MTSEPRWDVPFQPSSMSKAFCGAAPTPIRCNSVSLRPKSPLLPVHLIKTPNKILVFTAFVACQYRLPPPHLIPPIFVGPPDLIQCVQVRSRSREASIDQPSVRLPSDESCRYGSRGRQPSNTRMASEEEG